MGSQGGFGQSKEFLDLVKSIGEARSKAEEDRIVLHEIETLKRRIIEPDTPKRKMKEYIIRLLYVEMLGHDASFGYIHAVKMTHDDALSLKRTGYLAVTLFLNEDHDLIILIVNTIQKDLKSDNYLVVCAALNAVCRLINEETIPAVLPQVVELLGHAKEAVRKKAVMALHRFFQRSPSSVSHLVSNFRKEISRELAMGSQGGFGQSREFLNLVESIGKARSKAEEDQIVLHKVRDPKMPNHRTKHPETLNEEYIIRLLYVEMLDHDASFGYVRAVKMTHDAALLL
ncbi:hypothetical protein RHSIM_Rhsim11G0037700 [Rhododendron simsii]|uniref:Clathrin/coatomer adaptor adaptin-like N-terminal domain-containing protein n=1 Tax=Rhododendron simsii TaxID=118357 RepID=A0A834LAV2_RHOSS|nr:hypothetical protein RHSIM_Rhsim11G0037700 [Rhododendron simsii]